ncbi:MAG: hypothetical protein J6B04_01860 [Clostridia bacterium]|nr:hypothetical protein [Clostridia bacterium]
MPDYFSHRALALKVLKDLDYKYKSKISSRTLYLLGAQGGDLFYTYKLSFTKNNLGKILHAISPLILFEKLIGGNPSYAAGFATHYAFDCAFHPVVYAFERKKRAPLTHFSFENDLGLFICDKLNATRRIIPFNDLLKCTFPVYDSISKVEKSVTVEGIERSLKRHYTTSDVLFRTRRFSYKYDFDYESLTPVLNDAVALAKSAVCCVLDKDINEKVFSGKFLYYGE